MNVYLKQRALVAGCTALLLLAGVLPGADAQADPAELLYSDAYQRKPQQWYMQVDVSVEDVAGAAQYQAANPVIFGKLADSKNGYDGHDVPPFSALSGARVAGAFLQDSWREHAGEYLSDYRPSNNFKGDWLMTVFSAFPDGLVTLSWDPLIAVLPVTVDGRTSYMEQPVPDSETYRQLHLVDLALGAVVLSPGETGADSYSFTMDGSTARHFRWVVGSVKHNHLLLPQSASYKPVPAGAQSRGASAEARAKNAGPRGHWRFGLPPG